MIEIDPQSHYADVIERALYNTVLSGMAQDGKSFFYVNPLEVLPEASKKDSRKRHIKPVRQKWFGCACCPPNLARLISSIGEYCYTQNDDTIFIHQFMGSNASFDNSDINIESDYINSGKVSINIKPNKPFTLAVRIPSWCENYTFSLPYELKNGYAYFNIIGDTNISAKFEVETKIIQCSNRVRANIGKVAVTRGPFVYCIEEVDNKNNLQLLKLSEKPDFKYENGCVIANGLREVERDALYSNYKAAKFEKTTIKFIPYYKWGNRGENEMSVYIRI
jgi:DUF1680 family protein